FSNRIAPLPRRRCLTCAAEHLPIPHNQPPRLLHVIKTIKRAEATHILLTRIRRQLQCAPQLIRVIAQYTKNRDHVAVDVVVDFNRRRRFVEQDVRGPSKRLDIRVVRRKGRDDPPPTTSLAAVVRDDGTHPASFRPHENHLRTSYYPP